MKNKQISIGNALMLMLVAAVATFNVTFLAVQNDINSKLGSLVEFEQQYERLAEVDEYISKYYVGEYDPEEAMDTALMGYVVGIGDKWSHYLTKEDFEAYNIESSGDLVGIGVNIYVDYGVDSIEVTGVFENSPAEDVGIVVGDYIVEVNGEDVTEIGAQIAINNVRGTVGSEVDITVLTADGDRETHTITRKRLEVKSISHEMLEGNVGYVKIEDFDQDVDKDFEDAVDELIEDGATSLIFDVRFNPGGSVVTMTNMLDKLLPEGDIITLTNKLGDSEVYRTSEGEIDLPMAVIVNENSVSAAEFFAAALQEYEKATIVGTKTGGKGYSQIPIELSDGSGLILSTNEYFTPNGKNLANVGVTPDVVVELPEEDLENFYKLETAEDDQITAAIEEVTK